MRQAAGGCKQFASLAIIGDNGGMKIAGKSQSVTGTAIRRKSGIREKTSFLLGSDYVLKGWMPVPRPYKYEYEKMSVPQIAKRIREDLNELIARAYTDRQMFADGEEQRLTGQNSNLSNLEIKKQAAQFAEWILNVERIQKENIEKIRKISPTPSRETAEDEKRAAKSLAYIVKHGATCLEYLFVRRSALMREVAEKNDLWPVNLGLKAKKVNGRIRNELTRRRFASDYLTELGLNTKCNWPSHDCTGAEDKTPFWYAARELYTTLLQFKQHPEWYSIDATKWKKDLMALTEPMTKRTFPQWWKVAKVFLDEEWTISRENFKPLIQHLKIKGKQSVEKTRVVDQSLRDAFYALASSRET